MAKGALVSLVLALVSQAYATGPAVEEGRGVVACVQQSREAALRSYNLATSPFSYYLPPSAALVGAAMTSPVRTAPNPEFRDFLGAYARDLEFTQRYSGLLNMNNRAAGKVTAHATKKMFLTDAEPVGGSNVDGLETFEEFRGRVSRSFGVNMPDRELRAAHEELVRVQRAMHAYRKEYREFTRTSEFRKYGLKIEILNHTQGWREFIDALGSERYRSAQDWSERLQERAARSMEAPSAELSGSVGRKALGGAGAGLLVAVAAGTPARLPLIQHNCAGNLTLAQANGLLDLMTASTSGECTLTATGALELMKMPREKLEKLCGDIPQLPWVLDSAYLARLEKRKALPRPESFEIDCKASTVHASVRGRHYSYRVAPADRDHLAVRITASGVGGKPFTFDNRFNNRTKSYLVNQTSDISMNSTTAASDEILIGEYLDRLGESSSDPYRRNRAAAGESLNLGRSLIPAMKAFCDGLSPGAVEAAPRVTSDQPL